MISYVSLKMAYIPNKSINERPPGWTSKTLRVFPARY